MTAQDLPTLAAEDAEVRHVLADRAIPHRQAARHINAMKGAGTTSEKSVRRYRKRLADGEVPQPTRTAGIPKKTTGNGSGSWMPRIDIDQDGGEFFTVPQEAADGQPEPQENDLLGQFDLDPEQWEVVSARKSLWQGGPGGSWLEAHKVSFRKRQQPAASLEMDIDGIMSAYTRPFPPRQALGDKRIVMVVSGDLQLGKPEGGGTPAIIDRFCRITDDIYAGLAEYTGDQMLILPWVGDCIEGNVAMGGRLPTDLSVTEQVRAYRRLMMHQIAKLAPVCEEMWIPVVPGNHDATAGPVITSHTDSWSIEGASAVADWMAGRPEYAHVHFVFPPEGEPDITMEFTQDGSDPYTIAFIHGHVKMGNGAAKVLDWWKGQSHGRQAAGQADMLVSGHYHHLRVEHTGGGRTWLQIPALDGGSAWFRQRSGEESPTGIVSVEITPGSGQGWKGLTVHS